MPSPLSISVAAITCLAPLAIVAAPSYADTPGCVSKHEFRLVEKGWSATRVHRLFDTRGTQTTFFSATSYMPAEQWREYSACSDPEWGSVEVDYVKRKGVWRVTNKWAVW